MRTLLALLAVPVVILVIGCGDAPSTSPSSASAQASSKPSGKPSATTAASTKPAPASAAAPSASASAGEPDAGDEKEFATGDEFLKSLKLPAGSSAQKFPNEENFGFSGPKDTKFTAFGNPSARKWGAVTFGDVKMAAMLVNHEQEQGEKCPSIEDVKKTLAGAKIVSDSKSSVTVVEKDGKHVDYGDKIEVLVFEQDGKQGFYAFKEFDHGDDGTRVCCTAGAPADAKELKGRAEPAQIEAMAAVCLGTTFTF